MRKSALAAAAAVAAISMSLAAVGVANATTVTASDAGQLKTALASAKSGDVVRLGADVELKSSDLDGVALAKAVTLDCNSHKLIASGSTGLDVASAGSLTIKNMNLALYGDFINECKGTLSISGGKLNMSDCDLVDTAYGAKIAISGVTTTGDGYLIDRSTFSTVTVSNSTLEVYNVLYQIYGGTTTLSSCKLTLSDAPISTLYGGTVNMNGLTVTSGYYGFVEDVYEDYDARYGTPRVNVRGGTYNCDKFNCCFDVGTASIQGATFNVSSRDAKFSWCTLSISKSTLSFGSGCGIDLYDASASISDSKLTFRGNSSAPIELDEGNNVTLSNNVISSDAGALYVGRHNLVNLKSGDFVLASEGPVLAFADDSAHNDFKLPAGVKLADLQASATRFTLASNAVVSGLSDKAWTGKAIAPATKVSVMGKALAAGTNYTVAFSNNVKVGTAKVTYTFKGSYLGTVTKTFKIVPKKAAAPKVTVGTGKLTVSKWSATGASKYKVQARVKGGKWVTKKTVSKPAKVTVKKLKKGKKYQVRIVSVSSVKTVYGSARTTKAIK